MKSPKSEYFQLTENELTEFRSEILSWYNQHKRKLPWRTDPNLYKTVVSEFMLQQTRVITVLPYFKKWLKTFPDFRSLAKAREEKVLKAWEGLGYYSRARNLHRLAKIAATWEDEPQDLESWKSLPGVGPYIAAAVTSIAFNQAEAVCDGNLVRAISRIFVIDTVFKSGGTAQKQLQWIAQILIDEDHPGDFNQAMMELGATLCLPKGPLCTVCPILKFCSAGQTATAEKFPVISKKAKKKKSIRRYWVESSRGLLLFCHSNSAGRMSGIHELPERRPNSFHMKSVVEKHLATKKRTIGNVEYSENIVQLSFPEDLSIKLEEGFSWVSKEKIDQITLSGPHRKWIQEIQQ